jgi:putative redox protein
VGTFSVKQILMPIKKAEEWISRRLSFEQTLTEEAHQKILDICPKTQSLKL